jgi:glycosyltransferase involved in cell wall biosynthesis
MTGCSNPVVSVIVPARNEEACLALCLDSLVAQTGINFEIMVVDDASTDRTAEIARSFATENGKSTASSRADLQSEELKGTTASRALTDPNSCRRSGDCRGVQLVSAPPLPENWTGKNNAMSAGAKIAHTNVKWLLFTDADTVHKPGSLARAVAEAAQHGAALLSYSPEQEVRTFWEKAVMPVIFAELATTYPPQAVNDPTSPIAAANGQYLLISREAYDAVGGHTKIGGDLLEDVAMARLVKSCGRKIFFRYGGDAVRTRMYRSWAQMKEGWTKNLALLFPRPRALALLRSAEFVLIIGNLTAAIWASLSGRHTLAIQTSLLTIILAGWFWMRIRKAHSPMASSAAATLGLPLFSYLLVCSARLHRSHNVSWKGRKYGSSPGDDNESRITRQQLRRSGI